MQRGGSRREGREEEGGRGEEGVVVAKIEGVGPMATREEEGGKVDCSETYIVSKIIVNIIDDSYKQRLFPLCIDCKTAAVKVKTDDMIDQLPVVEKAFACPIIDQNFWLIPNN